MTSHPQTIEVLDTLRKNSHVGKHRHFSASERTNLLHIWFGIPGVVISVVLGSTFFVLITKEIPIEAKWAGAVAALVAAVLSAIQTFFNFQKASESHRTVANQYLSIQRECERLLASYCDGLATVEAVSGKLVELNARYEEVTKAAEGLRTKKRDYDYALRLLQELEAGERERKALLYRTDSGKGRGAT
ncbi:MAG TPA: SLATT domain-containing protein [Povalibacter sp.]